MIKKIMLAGAFGVFCLVFAALPGHHADAQQIFRQQQRRDNAANWTAANPTLAAGEIGFETNTGRFKIGNGSTAWNSLAYEDSQPANPTATIGLTAVNGSAATFMRSDGAPALSQAIAPTWTGVHSFTPDARSSGISPYWTCTAPADTGITAGTEAIGVRFAGATRTRAAGAVTTQREIVFESPTYAAASATTITNAATVAIAGPPTAGTNVTITNRHPLWIQSGVSRFDANITVPTYGWSGGGSHSITATNNGMVSVGRAGNGDVFRCGTFSGGNEWTLSFFNVSNTVDYVGASSGTTITDHRFMHGANVIATLSHANGNQFFQPVVLTSSGNGPGTLRSPARSTAQIATDTNNYSPGVGIFQRWSSDASRNVTGMVAGVDGEMRYVWNVGAQNIVLANESASSTAANRFTNSTGADITLTPNRCALMMYDSTSSRWRVTLLP